MRIELDKDIEARVNNLAHILNRSADRVVQEAVTQYLSRAEKRHTVLQEVSSAWDGYLADGLHVDAAAADQWLAALENGQETDLPAAHR